MKKERADNLLVKQEVAETVEAARALLMSGRVIASIEGKERKVEKAGEKLPLGTTFRLTGETKRYVSRAGEKLAHALDTFGIDVAGRIAADIGLSTGGFTDCLLQRGAARVYGVDVGYGDVAWPIRNHPNVRLFERTNARNLEENHFGELVSLVTIDVSFIKLAAILPAVLKQLEGDGEIVALVKPQFEAKKEDVPGGVIRDEAVRRRTIDAVKAEAEALGLETANETPSPLPGRDGNVEHLVHWVRR